MTSNFADFAMSSNSARLAAKTRRQRRLIGTSLSGGVLVALAAPAAAAPNACGVATQGTVVCLPDGNPYPTGIQYQATGPLAVVLVPGVEVEAGNLRGVEIIGVSPGSSGRIVSAAGVNVRSNFDGLYVLTDINNGGNATVESGATVTAGRYAIGAFSGTDATAANSGALTVTGTHPSIFSIGIFASAGRNASVTNSGAINVDSTDLQSVGIVSQAQRADSRVSLVNSGNVNVVGQSAEGLSVFQPGFDAAGSTSVVSSGTVTVVSTDADGFARGIVSLSDNDTVISSSGAITATSNGTAFGIFAETGTGPGNGTAADLTITSSAITANGRNVAGATAGERGSGILASTAGDIRITSGTISTTGSVQGITALGGATTSVTSGTVTTAGEGADGIFTTATAGPTTINSGTVTTGGREADGIVATATTGALAITSGTVTTGGVDADGILATTTTGRITVRSGAVTTVGADSEAIAAISTSGPVDVGSTGAINTTGANSTGIRASTTGAIVVASSGSITTRGASAAGIATVSSGGPTTITNSGAIGTAGSASGGIAAEGRAITVANTGSVTTAGANAAGISLFGPGNQTVTGRGTVTTTGAGSTGLTVRSTDGNVSVQTGPVSTAGANAPGIFAQTPTGSTMVDATTVRTTGASSVGIDARGTSVLVTATDVGTTGANSNGISATATTGAATVNSGSSVVTGGGSTAILARSTGGTVTVNSGIARAVNRNAIDAASTNGAVVVNITGATVATEAAAVNVAAGTTATVNVAAGGSVRGSTSGIVVTAPTSIAVNNAGVIIGGDGFSIDASGGPATVTNTGSIDGALRLTGSNDTFNNQGDFNAGRVSQFGAGDDTVNNSGTIFANAGMDFGAGTDTLNNSGSFRVLPFRPAATTVALTGLEAFNNSGLVDLRNGRTGDVLSTSGNFTGSGNSTLGLDVNFGAATTADRFNVGGAVTGSTTLALAITGDARLGNGPILVQGGAGTTANAITFGTTQAGLVQLELAFANNAFSLVGTPSDAAFRTTAFSGALRDLWYESAEAWSAQMREGRDTALVAEAGEAGARFWFQGYGRNRSRDQGGSFTAFGRTRTVDLSYDQDFFGGQIGMDFGGGVGEQGGFAFGLTGGYVDSHVNFEGVGDDLRMEAINIGGYARFSSGAFFVNALAKYDHILDVEARSLTADFNTDIDGDLYGASLEAGLRFGGAGFYLEPVATLSYVRSDLEGFAVRGTSVDFDDDNGLRGSAGARLGTTFGVAGGATANLYAGAHYVHDFAGNDEVVFASGADTVRIAALDDEDFVKALVGLNIAGGGNLSGFFEGSTEFLNDRSAYGARAGVRLRF